MVTEKQLPDVGAVFDFVYNIVAENIAYNPEVRQKLRAALYSSATMKVFRSKALDGLESNKHRRKLNPDELDLIKKSNQYKEFFDMEGIVSALQAPRVISLNRGERESTLIVLAFFSLANCDLCRVSSR